MSKYTSIPVLPETKAKLDAIGHKGETYNDLILRLLSMTSGDILDVWLATKDKGSEENNPTMLNVYLDRINRRMQKEKQKA